MRGWAVPVAILLSTVVFAGCVNTEKDKQPTPASVSVPTPLEQTGGSLTVKRPLETKLATSAPAWVKPGSAVDFAASAPTGANGTVSYVWAVGALPGTVEPATKFEPTTGSTPATYIQSGGSKDVKFTTSGSWLMHCHPHPWMKSNVTVLEGYQGPAQVTVNIIDGAKPNEYRFVPENIVIGVNTVVHYVNKGAQPHTATTEKQDPPVKKLAASGATAAVTLDGAGWQRLRLFAIDSDGRIGIATHDIYVAELPSFEPKSIPLDFLVGGLPDPVQGTAQGPASGSFVLDWNGTIFVNFTAKDVLAANGAPNNLATVSVHVKQSGATQDTLTSDGKAEDALSAPAPAGSYGIVIAPTMGVKITGTVTIEVVYDLDPPAPVMASADGHGDHAGH